MQGRQSDHPDSALNPSIKHFFALSLDLYCTIEQEHFFKYLNSAWPHTVGFSLAELSGLPYHAFIHPDDREFTRLEMERLSATGQNHMFENRFRCKDGSYRTFLWTAVAVRDEGIIYAMGRDITEQRRKERRLAAQYAVANVLSEAPTFEDAIDAILSAISRSLDWGLGLMWKVDPEANLLRCAKIWSSPGVNVGEFEAVTGVMTFPPSVGLPGRVWSSRSAAWIPDIIKDKNFPRMPFAASSGLHGAFAFPVIFMGDVVGVMEFFSQDIQELDDDLLQMMGVTGFQIGQFLARKRAEEEQERLINQLQEALANVKTLSGLLPICSGCKKIRDDKGYWNRLEDYILAHSEAHLTHGLCSECARKMHPDWDEVL